MNKPRSELIKGRGYQSKRGPLLEAMIAVVDADEDQDYRFSWKRFWQVLRRQGWKPPTKETGAAP
jgi:hypothetical protein